ncbi:U-box domain [Dillenia turbinata]|uniref:RING-type E3 ubiquitin transferase n=1 Tax=Dillenia turbinata TaxID=194707 RepID=A0AAN8VRG3_9MAGN
MANTCDPWGLRVIHHWFKDSVTDNQLIVSFLTPGGIVHRSICLELQKFVNRISEIFATLEFVRPRCQTGILALCSINTAIEKAKLLILHCSESSKLYLAITARKILWRSEKIRGFLECSLGQIQEMVPTLVAAQISHIIDDLRAAKFTLDSAEEEAGKVVLNLIRQEIPGSNSNDSSELKALQIAALTLHITSPVALLIEKRCINRLLNSTQETDATKKKILKYLLYLLRKYETIIGHTLETITEYNGASGWTIDKETYVESDKIEINALDTPDPPEEFKCPISGRLMYDPVVIASGQTFEKASIEKWLNEGNQICPVTGTALIHLSLTVNAAIKELISKWCLKHGVTVSPPRSAPFLSRKTSCATSIASFGSSLDNLQLHVSNVSIRTNGTESSDSRGDEIGGKLNDEPLQTKSDPNGIKLSTDKHGINLVFLSKLGAIPWVSQCMAVAHIKNQMKSNEEACYSAFSYNYVKPLIRFLKDARQNDDLEAQRNGAEVLLAFLKTTRAEMPPLREDAIYTLASFLDSEITGVVLSIIEVLSCQQYFKSEIVASGVLPSISKILDSRIRDHHVLAVKILCNLSSNRDIGHHIIYLDCIPKLVALMEDRVLAGYCVKIFKNLSNIEEALVALDESEISISSFAKLLDNGSQEEQEHAVEVILTLCYLSSKYCDLVVQDNLIKSLINLSKNGSIKANEIALELVQLLRGPSEYVAGKCAGSECDDSTKRRNHCKKKRSSAKASNFLVKKMPIFSKART